MAVSADFEASVARGINGNQLDNTVSESGAVYVFSRAGTIWSQQAYVKASNSGLGDRFGSSVALSANGSTMAVGAAGEANSATGIGGNQFNDVAPQSGAVYVFSRAGTVWSQQAYVKGSNTGSGDFFGSSVTLSANGNTMAVGAAREGSAAIGVGGNQADNTAVGSGAVYVFSRTGTAWSQQAYIKASNTNSGDLFGVNAVLSADGNTMAVGAFLEDSAAAGIGGNQLDNTALDSGAVYVFSRVGVIWSQQAYVKASNTEANDLFGRSVTLSADGNTMAVGATSEDSSSKGIGVSQTNNFDLNAGAVYVFSRVAAVWSQQAYVKASNTGIGDLFGISVSLNADGSTIAIGASLEGSVATGVGGNQLDNTAFRSGAIYLY